MTPMRSKPFRVIAVLAVIAGLSACGNKETQKSLARRFRAADRAIASYDMGGGFKASMPLTTAETKRLIETLPKGERISGACATPDMQIEFYEGTNSLGMLKSAGGGKLFWIDHRPHSGGWRRVTTYAEKTGTLESFFWRVRTQAASATPDPRPRVQGKVQNYRQAGIVKICPYFHCGKRPTGGMPGALLI